MSDSWSIPRREALDLFDHARNASSEGLRGFYNANVVASWRGTKVVVRIPLHAADRMDLMVWPEERVLEFLADRTTQAPRVLFASNEPRFQIHGFVAGEILDRLAPRGVPVANTVIEGVVELLRILATLPANELPRPPANWPDVGDSVGLLSRLVAVTREVYERAGSDRELLAELGVPHAPLRPIEISMGRLSSRPHVLVHADIHRKNVIMHEGKPVILDWELAIPGDPVYEIAVHLHKMAYLPDERDRILSLWQQTLPGHLTRDWRPDLDVYLAHERVKSAIVDTIRYAGIMRNGASTDARDALVLKLITKLNAAHSVWGTDPPTARRVSEAMTAL